MLTVILSSDFMFFPTQINFAPASYTGETLFRRKKGSPPDPLPKTAEFDMSETKILHKIILYCNFVILPAVNFKN